MEYGRSFILIHFFLYDNKDENKSNKGNRNVGNNAGKEVSVSSLFISLCEWNLWFFILFGQAFSYFLSLYISLHSPLICGVNYVCGCLPLHSIISLWSRSPHILQQPQSVFLGSTFFVGFYKFPSLVCWCTVIHHHRPQGLFFFFFFFFFFEEWDGCVQCTVLSPIWEDLVMYS